MKFDKFIAIDWSGATGHYSGVAVAACRAGRSAPKLIHPPTGTRWTRQAIADWLIKQLTGPEPLLFGFDFGFSFPFEPDIGYLAGTIPAVDDALGLWAHIEARSCGDLDFGCGAFVNDPDHASLFWKSGSKPRGWIELKRETENACAAATKTHPETLYKLLGPRQVGKASITGMRVLHHVRSSVGRAVSVWPFERVQRSALVEIYRTLFRYRAAHRTDKLTQETLNAALPELNSEPLRLAAGLALTDHQTDALISAAGLRDMAQTTKAWDIPKDSLKQARREGWIFGVGAGYSGTVIKS